MKRGVLYAVLLVLIAAGGFCGYRYYLDVIQPEQQISAEDEKQNEMFARVKPEVSSGAAQEHLLEAAEAVSSSVTAWLTIPGTHIDYPVCQAEDNDFYLHNGFDGQYNYELGCPFLDCRCAGDFSGFNSIVYGHHITKQRMFADISLYKEQSFFSTHAAGELVLNNEVHTVRFFAYLNVNPTSPAYQAVFATDAEKRAYLEYLEETADYCMLFADELDIENLRLLLLSTCTYEFDDARGILVGVIE